MLPLRRMHQLNAPDTSSCTSETRLVIVEDQKLFLALLRDLCAVELGLKVIGTATTASDALRICRELRPHLVLMDINLPDGDGLGVARKLKEEFPDMRIVAVSAECTDYILQKILSAGIDGFVDKNSEPDVLAKAITEALAGRTYFSENMQLARQQMISEGGSFSKLLTDAELKLMPFFGLGLDNEQIALKTGNKVSTIRWHRKRIMKKLNIHSATNLVRYAIEKGFVQTRTDGRSRPSA